LGNHSTALLTARPRLPSPLRASFLRLTRTGIRLNFQACCRTGLRFATVTLACLFFIFVAPYLLTMYQLYGDSNHIASEIFTYNQLFHF
jgi:recombinational DNA repair protein (RecF pathway)